MLFTQVPVFLAVTLSDSRVSCQQRKQTILSDEVNSHLYVCVSEYSWYVCVSEYSWCSHRHLGGKRLCGL